MLRPNLLSTATVCTLIVVHAFSAHAFVSQAPKNALNCKQFSKSSTTKPIITTKREAFIGWDALETFYQTSPYYAAFVTCSVKASAADAVAQIKKSKEEKTRQPKPSLQVKEKDEEEHQSFDLFRNLAFIFYGGFYQGMGQTFLYTNVYPLLFGSTPSFMSVVGQASIENFILAPFFCLPCGYTIKALLSGGTPHGGISKYVQHISSQHRLFRYWSIWFPVQCLNFAVVPEHLRVPFGVVVSFFWVCLLSSIAARDGDDETVSVDQRNQQDQLQQDPFAGLQTAVDQVQKHVAYSIYTTLGITLDGQQCRGHVPFWRW